MKILFLDKDSSSLSDDIGSVIKIIKYTLFTEYDIEEVFCPEAADAIIIQEKNSFKNFRYIAKLHADTIISAYPEKVFTINSDDCATGLLRGLYTSLPSSRFNSSIFSSVPYAEFPNEYVFAKKYPKEFPAFLATWRGNTKSNKIRRALVNILGQANRFCVQCTDSWLNHSLNEKLEYVSLIRQSKFSLCPAGWAPVSFRIYESMALGKCPVIIADDFVPPKGPDWTSFALFVPENSLRELPDLLLKHEHRADQLGENALHAWHQYFSSEVIGKYYANTLLNLILSTPKTSKLAEFERWNSFSLYWDNKWTIPQRCINKVSKIGRNFINK